VSSDYDERERRPPIGWRGEVDERRLALRERPETTLERVRVGVCEAVADLMPL
jgi:hypothetical protein